MQNEQDVVFHDHTVQRPFHSRFHKMSTYADQMASKISNESNAGPVRLWISKGSEGEVWEEEELMEATEEEKGEEEKQSENENRIAKSSSVLVVLDTNSLIHSLNLVKLIYKHLWLRNCVAIQEKHFNYSPVSLMIPFTVVQELDNLKKVQNNRQLMSNAQLANRWILEAQKEPKIQGIFDETAWALHVENSVHAEKISKDILFSSDSPDEEIISYCKILKRNTSCEVWLCSSDVNIQLRAENENIKPFDLKEWQKDQLKDGGNVLARDRILDSAIPDLLSQWEFQQSQLSLSSSSNFEYPATAGPNLTNIDQNLHQFQNINDQLENINAIESDKKVQSKSQSRRKQITSWGDSDDEMQNDASPPVVSADIGWNDNNYDKNETLKNEIGQSSTFVENSNNTFENNKWGSFDNSKFESSTFGRKKEMTPQYQNDNPDRTSAGSIWAS